VASNKEEISSGQKHLCRKTVKGKGAQSNRRWKRRFFLGRGGWI